MRLCPEADHLPPLTARVGDRLIAGPLQRLTSVPRRGQRYVAPHLGSRLLIAGRSPNWRRRGPMSLYELICLHRANVALRLLFASLGLE